MLRFVLFRLLSMLFFVMAVIFAISNFWSVDLPEPVRQPSGADGCVVSEKEAKVHNGEKGFENAQIQFVNNDGTIQVQIIGAKLAIVFKTMTKAKDCFRKGWITPVTIENCTENSEGECDFKLPHTVYVRSRPVNIVAWKYPKSAH